MNTSEKKTLKSRKRNFSKEEILALCAYVKQHRDKLFGKAGHCSQKVEVRKNKYWAGAVDALRAAGGVDCRSGAELKKKWCDLKVLAKKYDLAKHKTGGGPAMDFNPIFEVVLAAMAPQARDGITSPGQTETDPLCQGGSSQSSQESSCSVPAPLASADAHPPIEPETPKLPEGSTPQSLFETTSSFSERATRSEDMRRMMLQEEIIKIEKAKLEVSRESLKVQKGILAALQSLSSSSIFNQSMQEE